MQSLHSQKLEVQTSADSYIIELEDQLECCKSAMTQERDKFESMRKKYEKDIEELGAENLTLITELDKVYRLD